jgi:hypothetical protein
MGNKKLYILFLMIFPVLLFGQIPGQGPNNPSTATNVALFGSNASWTNLGNISGSDNTYATYGTMSGTSEKFTDYLQATNFGFSIGPAFSIIGIVVEIERSDPGNTTSDYSVRLVKNGFIVGSDLASPATYSTTDNTQTYGGIGEFWGESWSPADVNSSNFGVAISVKKQGPFPIGSAARIDNIRIRVLFDNGTLPVRLISFQGNASNTGANLSWTTEEESHMDYFQIEKSTDLKTFKAVNQTKCRNQAGRNEYTFNDPKLTSGTTYYRLKLMEENGAFSYSKVVALKIQGKNENTINPSAILNNTPANVLNPDRHKLRVNFYSQSGILLGSSETNSSSINVQLPAGTFGIVYYSIENASTGQITNGKLFVR